MKFGSVNPNAVRPTASPVKGQGVTGGPRPGLTNPNAVKPTSSPVKGQGVTGGPRPGAVNANSLQFMSDALRKGTMAPPRSMMKKGGAVKKTVAKKVAAKKPVMKAKARKK